MFVPNEDYRQIGQFVRLAKPLETKLGTFTKGHRFRVVALPHSDGLYYLKDEDGHYAYATEGHFEQSSGASTSV